MVVTHKCFSRELGDSKRLSCPLGATKQAHFFVSMVFNARTFPL